MLLTFAFLTALLALVHTSPIQKRDINDFNCKTEEKTPVVFLHGLGATFYEDINLLQAFISSKGFCTFSSTYGAYEGFPFVGGLKPVNESAAEITEYIQEVLSKTSAKQVDLVGHSEGGFQSLYVPKFTGQGLVRKSISIAPPTHGTTFAGLVTLGQKLAGQKTLTEVIDAVGCAACADITANSVIVKQLNDGPIAQEGVEYTGKLDYSS